MHGHILVVLESATWYLMMMVIMSGHVSIYYRSIPGKRLWALCHNSRFSAYWALTRDTGHLPCVKIEVRGTYCSTNACALCMACTLVRAHARVLVLAKEQQLSIGIEKYKKRDVLSTRDLSG